MSEILDSGQRDEFATGAVRDCHAGKGRMDLLPLRALMRLAQHYEAGCQKYGDRNWEKGIPLSRYFDSAMRHLCKWALGWNDEPHLVAAAWNILCLLETVLRMEEGALPKELADMPGCETQLKMQHVSDGVEFSAYVSKSNAELAS